MINFLFFQEEIGDNNEINSNRLKKLYEIIKTNVLKRLQLYKESMNYIDELNKEFKDKNNNYEKFRYIEKYLDLKSQYFASDKELYNDPEHIMAREEYYKLLKYKVKRIQDTTLLKEILHNAFNKIKIFLKDLCEINNEYKDLQEHLNNLDITEKSVNYNSAQHIYKCFHLLSKNLNKISEYYTISLMDPIKDYEYTKILWEAHLQFELAIINSN